MSPAQDSSMGAGEKKHRFTLEGFQIVHRAMLQDVSRLEGLIRLVMEGKGVDLDVVRAWFSFVWRLAEAHHKSEDEEVFPRVAERNPAFKGHMEQILAEHGVLDKRVAEMERLMEGVKESEELVVLLDTVMALRFDLGEHVKREENAFVVAIQESFSESEQKALQIKLARAMPRRMVELVLPWMLESANEAEAGRILKQIPWPARILYRLSWVPFYESLVEPFSVLPKVGSVN